MQSKNTLQLSAREVYRYSRLARVFKINGYGKLTISTQQFQIPQILAQIEYHPGPATVWIRDGKLRNEKSKRPSLAAFGNALFMVHLGDVDNTICFS